MVSDSARDVAIGAVVVMLLLSATIVAAVTFSSTPAPYQGAETFGVEDGPEVTLVAEDETDVNFEDLHGDGQLDIETGEGAIVVGGDPGASARIDVTEIEGDQTVATEISAGADWLTLEPADKQRVDVRGDVDAIRFQAISVDDGTTDLELAGNSGGAAQLRLYGLPASESIVLYDPTSGTVLGSGETTSAGTLEASADLESSTQEVAVRTAGSFSAELSNPTPEGEVTELPEELAVDVTAEAYPATVTFELEGQQVGTVEATENGTVSTDVDVSELGTYNWSATVEDDVGQIDSVDVSFETPRELTIREEHDPQTLVDNSTLTLRFYTAGGEIAIERETTDGTLDMEGLPNSDFVVFVESEGHYDRRVYLGSIFEQTDIYLLNESEFPRGENDAIRSRFTYTDMTGEFPRADTTIQVQRSIDTNGDGTSEWRTVAGDFWGAGGEFEAILEHGARYRLFVQNQETGATDMVGTHIPTEDLAHQIRISGLTQEAENSSGVYANAQLHAEDGVIEYVYQDPSNETEELTVRVTSQDGDTELFNETVTATLGPYQNTVALNESQLEENWVVQFESDRHNAAVPVGAGSVALPVNVPGWLMAFLMSMAVTFVGALYGPRTALLGAWAMVFVASGAAMFGWAFSWPGVVAAALIAVGMTFLSRVMP